MPEIPLEHAVIGGVMMGLGLGALLLFNGRIGGIGGSFAGLVTRDPGPGYWRLLYLVGILVGGALVVSRFPEHFATTELNRSTALVLLSGVVMGVGGRMSNGCTSGHGLCGMARFSRRSIAATMSFFGCALASMYIFRHLLELY